MYKFMEGIGLLVHLVFICFHLIPINWIDYVGSGAIKMTVDDSPFQCNKCLSEIGTCSLSFTMQSFPCQGSYHLRTSVVMPGAGQWAAWGEAHVKALGLKAGGKSELGKNWIAKISVVLYPGTYHSLKRWCVFTSLYMDVEKAQDFGVRWNQVLWHQVSPQNTNHTSVPPSPPFHPSELCMIVLICGLTEKGSSVFLGRELLGIKTYLCCLHLCA